MFYTMKELKEFLNSDRFLKKQASSCDNLQTRYKIMDFPNNKNLICKTLIFFCVLPL